MIAAAVLFDDLARTPCGSDSYRSRCEVERLGQSRRLGCGPILLLVQATTIASLIVHSKPSPLPERGVRSDAIKFAVTAQVVRLHSEDDGNVHLVLEDAAGHTMIAEAPTASCNRGATAYRRDQMDQARAAVKLCGKAEITGVAFSDFFHNQHGVAPNEIKLHPILSFR